MSAESHFRVVRVADLLPLQWGRALMSAERRATGTANGTGGRLQWGRALMSAERYVYQNYGRYAGTLQWGRALMSAERPSLSWDMSDITKASMGPRSNERGKAAPVNAESREQDELQWGRALMSAERRKLMAERIAPAVASMGPRSNERGKAEGGLQRFRRWHASMGPRSNERGKFTASCSGP